MSLHFIAIVPPEPLKGKIHAIKLDIKEKYHSSHSLNAPPHITLLSPFDLKEDRKTLDTFIEHICKNHSSFEVAIKDFSHFDKGVFYLDIIKTKGLMELQNHLETEARKLPALFSYRYHPRPYQPHLTLAFKDLTAENFDKIQTDFKEVRFEASFVCNQLVLLKHEDKKWKEVEVFSLKG